MKKKVLLLPAFLLFAGCVVQGGQDVVVPEADAAEAVVARAVPLEEALEEMYSLMDAIEPGTRSSRTIKSIELIGGKEFGNMTRSGIVLPDSLLYLVNFDEGGFSVLAAADQLPPILALTYSGELTQASFSKHGSSSSMTLEERWVEEEQSYLLGGADPEEFIAQFLISYVAPVVIVTGPLSDEYNERFTDLGTETDFRGGSWNEYT